MSGVIFVAGTDTGVGKTVVAGCLVAYLQSLGRDVCYQKWVATGGVLSEDLAFCQQLARSVGREIEAEVPFSFALAASPHLAAEQEGRQVERREIAASLARLRARHEMVVVEGVGGLMVPLTRDLLLVDLVAEMGLPVLLVARSGLGTLNHTLLSLEALRRRNIAVVGVVMSDEAEELPELLVADNMRTIAEMGKVAVFGRLPRCDDPAVMLASFGQIGEAFCRGV